MGRRKQACFASGVHVISELNGKVQGRVDLGWNFPSLFNEAFRQMDFGHMI